MKDYSEQVMEAADFIKVRMGDLPDIGFLTGTGLDAAVKSIQVSLQVKYKDVPHFSEATVESHPGNLIAGTLQGARILAMQGRFHLYEGYSPLEVVFPVRVMQALGVRYLIVTNAAGGLNPDYKVGDLMIITDHINLSGSNPLVGLTDDSWGNRFPDMTRAYDEDLSALAKAAGRELSIRLQTGVYAGLKGPSLETPAETRFLKIIGADAVGFSTIQEVITAVQAGMKVLGISTITNINDPDMPIPATAEAIIAAAHQAVPRLEDIIKKVVEQIKPPPS